jgi:hypothetical protein
LPVSCSHWSGSDLQVWHHVLARHVGNGVGICVHAVVAQAAAATAADSAPAQLNAAPTAADAALQEEEVLMARPAIAVEPLPEKDLGVLRGGQ